jgi:hypothetical protein
METDTQKWAWNNASSELHSVADASLCLTVFADVPSAERTVWAAPLYDGSVGVVLYNIALSAQELTVQFEDVGFAPDATVAVRNLLTHRSAGTHLQSFAIMVPAHGVATLRLKQVVREASAL